MISGAIVTTALNVVLELLRAWNNLPDAQRAKLVDRWITDDDKRREDWAVFEDWWRGIWGRVHWS